MKNLLSILTIALFLSCQSDRKTKIVIQNSTNKSIDSLELTYGTEKEIKKYRVYDVNPKEKISEILDMNFKGIDGGYLLNVFQKERTSTQYFGYYSNALFENYTFHIKIENDTLIVKSDLMK